MQSMSPYPSHPLLGSRTLECTDIEPSWRNTITATSVQWLSDHIVASQILFPFTGYIAIAGEAIRQVLHVEDYVLRGFVVSSGLVIPSSGSVDVVTTLRRSRITEQASSDWFDFTISSNDGHGWVENSSGQVGVRDPVSDMYLPPRVPSPPRTVSQTSCYEQLDHIGFRYRGPFQGLEEIRASPTDKVATAVARENPEAGTYSVHPAILAFGIQMLAVANSHGMPRKLPGAFLPVRAKEIWVRHAPGLMRFEAKLDPMPKGKGITGTVVAYSGFRACLVMRGVEHVLKRTGGQSPRSIQSANLIWKCDPHFIPSNQLIRSMPSDGGHLALLERLAILCLVDLSDQVRSIKPVADHLALWRDWIFSQAELIATGQTTVAGAQHWSSWSPKDRGILRQEMEVKLSLTPAAPACAAIQGIADSTAAILAGETNLMSVLVNNKALQDSLDLVAGMFDYGELLLLLGHHNPALRILEIGAGLGATTAQVLSHLAPPRGRRLYSQYIFTDRFPALFEDAKARLREFPEIEYAVLDINGDLPYQKHEPGSYDLIIVSGLSSAAMADDIALQNVYKLLSPEGHLIVQEVNPGLSPLPDGYHLSTAADCAQTIGEAFARAGYRVEFRRVGEEIPPNEHAVFLVDLEGPYLYTISDQGFQWLLQYLHNSRPTSMLWVTRQVQQTCQDPRYSLILGAARTLRAEISMPFATVEAEDLNFTDTSDLLVQVYERFLSQQVSQSPTSLDSEYSLQDGRVHIGRYNWAALETPSDLFSPHADQPKLLLPPERGRSKEFAWQILGRLRPREDQITVRVACIGLGFQDVPVAQGGSEPGNLGLNCCGTVTECGSEVESLHIGDRVFVIGADDFRTHIVTNAALCVKIPDNLQFEEAATMPGAFATAIHSLINLGQLAEGQSVLVHSATSGTGIAALQLCKMRKAEIYATVGTLEEARYLMQTYGIPRDHIFGSQTPDFAPQLLGQTQERGVDLVLNSLTGELLHASWECVAPYGRMLELSKRDFLENGHLALAPFLFNRSYFGVDIADIAVNRPAEMRRLLQQCLEYYEQGNISPIEPSQNFPATAVSEAFSYMQQGPRMARVVVTMPIETTPLLPSVGGPTAHFREDATYLLVGGLGDLGRAIATWMVDMGARSLVFLSRHAGARPEHEAFLSELRDQGCHAEVVSGDVLSVNDIGRAVKQAPHPIRGVIQLAWVLKDAMFVDQSIEDWRAVLAPRVQGTWNLHTVLSAYELDFFLLMNSCSGISGQHGQSSYVAASTFLDSFAVYRRGLGLPATAVDLGVVTDIGYLQRSPKQLQDLYRIGVQPVSEAEVLRTLSVALAGALAPAGHPYRARNPIIGLETTRPLADPEVAVLWKDDPRMRAYHHVRPAVAADASSAATTTPKASPQTEHLAPAGPQDSASMAEGLKDGGEEYLVRQLTWLLRTQILGVPDEIDPWTTSLPDLGVDSLSAIEIRRWFADTMSVRLTVVQITRVHSVAELAGLAFEAYQRASNSDAK
ncbi:KR-domain-containing protein [Aspergillus violaceofuscus CBS 115571]|uniref:KR-domain-containing protein n=1 Tax=Aspergillus violaceofuscus (strain CBS 115571) TaxID=1450538 RepID=A0A2V5I6N7_ASPV1|nr:KR-domain-containing protein [Aspergillus violaceofuscus CBS 115571]